MMKKAATSKFAKSLVTFGKLAAKMALKGIKAAASFVKALFTGFVQWESGTPKSKR